MEIGQFDDVFFLIRRHFVYDRLSYSTVCGNAVEQQLPYL